MSTSRDPAIPDIGPTWHGYCDTTQDAMYLFEACLQGRLPHIPRRPQDREKDGLIKSGSIFIYEENASGIKRWTDGKNWSPSRILGNYLLYREVNDNIDPKDKKKAKKGRRGKQESIDGRTSGHSSPCSRRSSEGFANGSVSSDANGPAPAVQPVTGQNAAERDVERSFIGSLTDTYSFKHGGLVKKTASVRINGVQHHLVSYYTLEDAKSGLLKRPSQDQQINRLELRSELVTFNWRAPISDSREFFLGQQTWGSTLLPSQFGVSGYLMPQTYPMGQQLSQYQMPAQQQFSLFNQPETQANPRFNSQSLATRHSGNRSNRYEPYPSPAHSLSRTTSVPVTSEQQYSPATSAPDDSILHRRHSMMPQMSNQQFSPVTTTNMDSAPQQRPLMMQRVTEAQYMPATSSALDSVSQHGSNLIAHVSEQQYSPITPATTSSINSFGAFTHTAPTSEVKAEEFPQTQDSVRHDSAYGSYTPGTGPIMRDGGFRTENFQQPSHDSYNLYYDRTAAIPEWGQYDNVPSFASRTAI